VFRAKISDEREWRFVEILTSPYRLLLLSLKGFPCPSDGLEVCATLMKLLDPQGETDMSERVGSMGLALSKGITPAGSGKAGQPNEVAWSILGHTYWLKAECEGCFIFETLDPPGTFVPPHIHPTHARLISCPLAQCLGHEVAPT
jgi:hypothetical protein